MADAFEIDEASLQPELIIKNNEIICKLCDSFGEVLAAYNKQIFVGELEKVWIFDYDIPGIALAQEIELGRFGQLNRITIHDGILNISILDAMGTGSVRRYSKNGAAWEYIEILQIGREHDDFGLDIAQGNNTMVIGASARWSAAFDPNISDQGSFYVYSNKGEEWTLKQEIFAENSSSDDRFGTDVALVNDFILVSGFSIPLHIYHIENEEWILSSIENDIAPIDFGYYDNRVIYFSEISGLHSFKIAEDGTIIDLPFKTNIELLGAMPPAKDNIKMYENFAMVSTFNDQKVYLLELVADEWQLADSIVTNTGILFDLSSIELTQDMAIISGTDYDNFNSHVYLVDF